MAENITSNNSKVQGNQHPLHSEGLGEAQHPLLSEGLGEASSLGVPSVLGEALTHELLPQQPPFVMVGSLTHYDDENVETETLISPDNIFVDDGEMSSAGMIENIAQTCAVRVGYINKYILKKGVQIGVIGNVRKLKILGHPKAGTTIKTHVQVLEEIMGVTLAMATITCGDELLAKTQIKLAVKE